VLRPPALQSTPGGSLVKSFNSRTSSDAATPASHEGRASCPTCHSVAIVTTAKSPDADSYWRCTACGDVWNDSRRKTTPQYPSRNWR
jgi:predicted Zn finger-like uncharacterized protein